MRGRTIHRLDAALRTGIAAGALVAAACTASGCSRESKSASGAQAAPGGGSRRAAAYPVEVTPVPSRSVEYTVSAVGSIEAFEIVQVTARVAGAVEKVAFREGMRVSAGDILVEIEPERFRLGVEEALAALEKAEAALAEAQAGVKRRESANEKTPGLIPGEELDAWRTRARTARAEVSARQAAVQLAERNERDAHVRAPIGGIVQTRDVRTGEYVQPGSLLTTLVRRDPLLLRFQVPEAEAGRLAPRLVARFSVRNAREEHRARITHVAESADPESRMVVVTAEIENPDSEELRPGAFAEVTVPIGEPRKAPVIPQTAVRPSERGFLAFVVSDGVAHERVLSLGLRTDDGLVEVRDGLAAEESLVVRGAESLQEGARVRVVKAGSTVTGPARSGAGTSESPGGRTGERPAGGSAAPRDTSQSTRESAG